MELLSIIVLLLLSLFGYSAGAVIGASGKRISPKPFNLISILLIWTLAILTRASLGKWFAILVWLGIGLLTGLLITRLQKRKSYLTESHGAAIDERLALETNPWRRIWLRWTRFSSKAGDYQSRVILAFLYFTVVLPFGLVMRLFSDPLNTRVAPADSMWQNWTETSDSVEEARRQF